MSYQPKIIKAVIIWKKKQPNTALRKFYRVQQRCDIGFTSTKIDNYFLKKKLQSNLQFTKETLLFLNNIKLFYSILTYLNLQLGAARVLLRPKQKSMTKVFNKSQKALRLL